MNAREQGFLLLTGYLGDPERRPLTLAQFRELTLRARDMDKPETDREITVQDLQRIGCDQGTAIRIRNLLSQEEQLKWYLDRGARMDCVPVTRVSGIYPDRLRKSLGMDAPGVLWTKGDVSLLAQPGVAVVGSRELRAENYAFAQEAGKQAALHGLVLISGNARGADRAAQESCLAYGGRVISVVADKLEKYPVKRNVLYVSEVGFDLDFSSHRALQRNRLIHSLGQKTFVAQCTLGKGGTWDGTQKNLRFGWSPVFCFDDGSEASRELEQMGAVLINQTALQDLHTLQAGSMNFVDL